MRDKLIEEYHWDKYTATFHAVRQEICNKTGFSKIVDNVYNHYAKQVLEETNIEKLIKIKNRGSIEFKMSYLICLCSIVGVFISPLFAIGMIPGIYLNWKGEITFLVANDMLEEK